MAPLTALATALMVAGLVLTAQGCGSQTPASAATPGRPAVTQAQAQQIFADNLRVSDAAAVSHDRTAGLAVVSDAAWSGLNAAFSEPGTAIPRYQYGTPQFFIPRLRGYPRWFVAAVPRHPTAGPGGQAAAADVVTLMAFEQPKSGNPWVLSGAAALDPGESIPDIVRDSDGYATALSTHDSSVLLAPDVTGAGQAALADEGSANPAAAVVADGPQTTGIYTTQSTLLRKNAANGLHYTFQLEGSSFPTFQLRLADGGALVMYGMTLVTINQHPGLSQGEPIPVPADIAPLLPAGQIGYHAVYGNWTYELAAVDPSATAHDAHLTVIAATSALSLAHAY